MISRSLIGETDEEKMKNLFLRILPYFYVKHHSYDIDVNPAKNGHSCKYPWLKFVV